MINKYIIVIADKYLLVPILLKVVIQKLVLIIFSYLKILSSKLYFTALKSTAQL